MSEVSRVRKILQISCAIIWCLLAAGPVFGFAAIKPILLKEGVYSEKCKVDVDAFSHHPISCTAQDLSLNFLFTVACMVTNISALPVGWLLDEYGPKVSGIIGSLIIFLGAAALLFAKSLTFLDGYLVGYTLLALGGPFVFISCFQLTNGFPKNSGLILALLTGAFDSLSALFLVYRLIYTNVGALSLHKFFLVYLVVPVFIFLCQVTIMPAESYKTVATLAKIAETAIDESGKPLDKDLLLPVDRNTTEDTGLYHQPTVNESTSLLMRSASFGNRRDSSILRASRCSLKSVYEQQAEERLFESSGGVFGVMHGYSITQQLKSPWFLLMAVFTTIQMLRINYFVATVKAQELYLYGDEKLATTINHFFDFALPLGGLLAIPFIGLILDNLTTLTVLVILSVVSVVIGVLGCVAWLPATYVGIVLLVMYRPFYYTAVSDFCAKVFGFDTFGTVYGTIICFSGICNILQQVMDSVTKNYLNMNPVPINLLLTALTAVFAVSILHYVKSQEQSMHRQNLELEAQEASLRAIPR